MADTGDTQTIRVRVPGKMLDAIDTAAHRLGLSRSSVVRLILASDLTERGLWPPNRTDDLVLSEAA